MSLQIEFKTSRNAKEKHFKSPQGQDSAFVGEYRMWLWSAEPGSRADLTALWVRTAVGGGFPTELLGQGRWLFALMQRRAVSRRPAE